MKKVLALLLAMLMVLGLLAGCGGSEEVPTTQAPPVTEAPAPTEAPGIEALELPRNETLYLSGMQWGPITGWNVIGTNQNNAVVLSTGASGYRTLMFETLYTYDYQTGKLTGLLADGDYAWNETMTELTVHLKSAARWSDGTPVTAYDVQRTFDIGVQLGNSTGKAFSEYISGIVAVNDTTMVIKSAINAAGKPTNPMKMLNFLTCAPIAQADWIDAVVERNDNKSAQILKDTGEDVVWSGPYTRLYNDEQMVILIRDDNYWGQDASMFGKLPAPKYIIHNTYADADAAKAALDAGEADIYQSLSPKAAYFWMENGMPKAEYFTESAYGLAVTTPTAWYNCNLPVIAENHALRKAIAMAVDYDAIAAKVAVDGIPALDPDKRSLMNLTEGEQALSDQKAFSDLQWAGGDIDGANGMLDLFGLVDNNGDGLREYKLQNISLTVACPAEWTDWRVAVDAIAAVGKELGIEITPLYPELEDYLKTFSNPRQRDYSIFLWTPDAAGPSNPWNRANQILSYEYVGINNNFSGNWGQYVNRETDDLIESLLYLTDSKQIKDTYTYLHRLYLQEVPSFAVMHDYAPVSYTVNESVWTGYTDCSDISVLFDLKAAG